MLYTNWDYTLLRKSHGIPSTFGKQRSILDSFQDPEELQLLLEDSDFDQYSQYCYLDWYTKENLANFLDIQTKQFTKEQEYGLLNRLDNDTWGFLYFARNKESFQAYKHEQNKWLIQKMYLAEVYGNPFLKTDKKTLIIDAPIMHHRFDAQKMIVLTDKENKTQWRWRRHDVSTTIELISYDKTQNTSLIRVMINRWVRHQIRVHCRSTWSSIVGDKLYAAKSSNKDFLHLRSIGIKQN